MSDQTLRPEAGYGQLAFDCFLLENWDASSGISSPTAEEWTSLARRYLALTPRQRFPFHDLAYEARNQVQPAAAATATARAILAGHQTPQERNISAEFGMTEGDCDPIWLRLCYDPDNLQASYDAMAQTVARGGDMLVAPGGEFNNEALYAAESLEEGITRFLERAPEVVDGRRHPTEELYAEVEEDQLRRVGEWGGVGDEEVVLMYVVDRQSLEEGTIKACFVDRGGKLVWWNRLKPDKVLEFRGSWWALAGILGEFLDVNGVTEKGELLQI